VCCESRFTFWFTWNFTEMYITTRNNTYYYRRRIPLAIVSLCDSKYIHRPLSSDRVLAKQLAVKYNNIFNMIDIGLKLGHDVSNLVAELNFKTLQKIDIYEQYMNHKDVSVKRMAKIKRHLSVLKVLLPNDLKRLNMGILDGIRSKLSKLPKMNIQKYRVKSISELLKLNIPNEDKQSSETVNGYIKLLNALLKFAYEREAVSRQFSIALVKRSCSSRDERQALNIEEVKKLMDDSGNQKLIPLYKILYYSGMRLSEVYKCKITVVDGIKCFDLTDGTIELKTKSSYRLIPVHDSLDNVELLLEQARAVRDGYATRKISELFKTKGKTLYSLRHSFATQLASEGIETTIISELLGHSHNDMTLGRYVKGFPTKLLSEAINKLDVV